MIIRLFFSICALSIAVDSSSKLQSAIDDLFHCANANNNADECSSSVGSSNSQDPRLAKVEAKEVKVYAERKRRLLKACEKYKTKHAKNVFRRESKRLKRNGAWFARRIVIPSKPPTTPKT